MTAGDEFRRAKRRGAASKLRVGQRVRITKGALSGLSACILKNDIGGRWVLTLDGLGDKLYVILTEDALEVDSAAASG